MSKVDPKRQVEFGRKANRVLELKKKGYSNAVIAKLVELPEDIVEQWVNKKLVKQNQKLKIKDVIKNNKKEIVTFGGSVLCLGISVGCYVSAAKKNLEIMKHRGE